MAQLTLVQCDVCQVKVKHALEQVATAEQATVVGPITLESIAKVEERHIMQVLTSTDWNKSRAAQILGIERSTLDRKLKLYRDAQNAASVVVVPEFITDFISLDRLIDAARISTRTGRELIPVCAWTDGAMRTWAARPPLECRICKQAPKVTPALV